MKKKLTAFLMAAVLLCLFGLNAGAQAADTDEAVGDTAEYSLNGGIELCYENAKDVKADLSISNGTATCTTEVYAKSGVTTKFYINMRLQKKVLWWWEDVTNWVTETTGDYTFKKTTTVSSGNTYRVRASVTAYKGSLSEAITKDSDEVKT